MTNLKDLKLCYKLIETQQKEIEVLITHIKNLEYRIFSQSNIKHHIREVREQ